MKRRILLADDSVTIQKVIELTFMDEDYEVRAVSNGDEAVALLAEMHPDFVIADVHMPGANGYEVCRRAKAQRADLPVLLLVGTFEPFDEAQARAVGADSFLKKPFDSQELLQRVDELIAAKAPAQVAPSPEPAWAAPPIAQPATPLSPPMPAATPDWMAPHPTPDLAATPPAASGLDFMGAAAVPEFSAEPAWGSFELEPEPAAPAAFHAPAAASEPFDREPSFALEPDPGYADGGHPAAAEPVFALDEDAPTFGVREDVFGAPGELSLDEEPQDRYVHPEPAAPAAVGFDWNVSPVEAPPEPAETLHFDTPPVPAWQTPPVEPELRWSEHEAFVAVEAEPGLPPHKETPEEALPAPVAETAVHGGNGSYSGALSGSLSENDVDRIARRVVELLGDRTIRDVAWEVIPDLAEVIIRDRLRELEGQVE
jgi:CheY-like chemotaxis protein